MFVKVTRSAAVSALASGLEVRLDATGEILQLDLDFHPWSKQAARRLLTRKRPFDQHRPVTFSVLLR